MDREWAEEKLQLFLDALNTIKRLEDIAPLIADDESQSLRHSADLDDSWNTARTLEPTAQIIMNAVEPDLGSYRFTVGDTNDYEPAKRAALRALGLVQLGVEARERMRPDAPELSASELHRWVWDAARPLWETGNFSAAVLAAAQSVNARLQQHLDRYDIGETALVNEAFSMSFPQIDKPRLRFPGNDSTSTWRARQEGAAMFGRGCFMAMRNPAAHSHEHKLSRQEALEELAAFSRLARWINECDTNYYIGDFDE